MSSARFFDVAHLIRTTCNRCGLPKKGEVDSLLACKCYPTECCWCTPHHMIAGFDDDPRKASSGMCPEAAKKFDPPSR